ncbi:MAG TPA: S1C family serine protease [Candidatus Binatia bacterium]|nr:S1C family serine protease [Candidatus Binatia bacterium]
MDSSVELVRHLLQSVVYIHTTVTKGHPSTRNLGTQRLGSGVVVDASGLILTVNYVVMGGQSISVAFQKGRRAKAEIVAQDFEVGLALIKVNRPGLVAAEVGTGEVVERCDEVVLLGAMDEQERRATGGLVTYLGEFEAYWEYLLDRGIVTNAPNPGYPGGGLFTMAGRLAGTVSLNLNEITRSSLAIPVDFYGTHRDEMVRYGRVVSRPRRAWLGVFAHVIEEGVVVADVVPEGPGDRGGLQAGDLIVSLNAEEVASRRDLYMSLWRHEPGEALTFEVMRDNKVRRFEVKGGDRAHFYRQL